MRTESEFGEYGILELLPVDYIRELAESKGPSFKGKSKKEIISKLYNEKVLNNEDLENARNYYDHRMLSERDNSISCSIVKLYEIPNKESFIKFFNENTYEYNDKIISKDGYKILSEDPIKFEYWYDKKTIEVNPDNYRVEEEHVPKSVNAELDKENKLLTFNTHDSRKVSRIMSSLISLNNLKVISQRKKMSKDDSYNDFGGLIDKIDSVIIPTNNIPTAFRGHLINWINLFDPNANANNQQNIEKIFYQGLSDIMNNNEIIRNRNNGYFLIGIGGKLVFKDYRYIFRTGFAHEYQAWGDSLYIYVSSSSKQGTSELKNIFNLVKEIAIKTLI